MRRLILLLALTRCVWSQNLEEALGPQDAFIAFEVKSGRRWESHPELCARPELPASTFKIPNTLIGLETGVIRDAGHLKKWDGEKRWVEEWNQDLTLRDAFKFSALWYYQSLARDVGPARMQRWLDRLSYGNRKIGGAIDLFWWKRGELRITPRQQIDFLTRLQAGKLPVSPRSLRILREIMKAEKNPQGTLYAKTGWAHLPEQNKNVGWYVGFVERPGDALIFAFNTRTGEPAPDDFRPGRIHRTKACLKRLGWW